VAQSPGAVVSGHRAHGGSDAADRWGEAVGASRGGPRSARPPPRPTRTTTEDAAHRRHRAAHAPRLPTAYLSAGPHGRPLPPRVPRLPPPHRLWPCTRGLPNTVPPSRRRGAAAGPPIAGVRRGRPRRPDDATNGARSTGGGLRASACPWRPLKSRQWRAGCWPLAARSMRASWCKKWRQCRTPIDRQQTEPVPGTPRDKKWQFSTTWHNKRININYWKVCCVTLWGVGSRGFRVMWGSPRGGSSPLFGTQQFQWVTETG